jgi:hypothetical protein
MCFWCLLDVEADGVAVAVGSGDVHPAPPDARVHPAPRALSVGPPRSQSLAGQRRPFLCVPRLRRNLTLGNGVRMVP